MENLWFFVENEEDSEAEEGELSEFSETETLCGVRGGFNGLPLWGDVVRSLQGILP